MPDDVNAISTELHWLTIADAARLIEKHRLSPVELTDALLARIEVLDSQLNAFLLPTPEKAREQAKAAEREITAGSYCGPLHGIPFGLKDIYATAGIRTTSHSKICENVVPADDATTVTKLYQVGALLLGKLRRSWATRQTGSRFSPGSTINSKSTAQISRKGSLSIGIDSVR